MALKFEVLHIYRVAEAIWPDPPHPTVASSFFKLTFKDVSRLYAAVDQPPESVSN